MDVRMLALACVVLHAVTLVCGQQTVDVNSNVGTVMGLRLPMEFNHTAYHVDYFSGIPYAESTHGEGRFRRPRKKAPFDDVFNATGLSKACPQNIKIDPSAATVSMSEDCLTLTIITPEGASSSPGSKAVMVFIYGGGFQIGYQDMYFTMALPGLNDVIYVTVNYRVGIYGFLANRERGLMGNNGLWDQHMALQWVHDNIGAFGGDVNRITIFGESAGSASVIYQSLYEGNRGMFKRVMAESGAIGAPWSYSKYPEEMSVGLATRTGCADKPDWVSCLQQLDIDTLHDVISGSYLEMYSPIVDNEFIQYDPEDMLSNAVMHMGPFADLDLIMGINSNEGGMSLMDLPMPGGMSMNDLDDGLSDDEFDKLTRLILTYRNMTASPAMLASVKHAYTNWDMPMDAAAKRTEFLEFLSDGDYATPIVNRLRSHARANGMGTAYMYLFDVRPSWSQAPSWLEGANHGDELPYVLGFPIAWFGEVDPATVVSQTDLTISRGFMTYASQFAKTG